MYSNHTNFVPTNKRRHSENYEGQEYTPEGKKAARKQRKREERQRRAQGNIYR